MPPATDPAIDDGEQPDGEQPDGEPPDGEPPDGEPPDGWLRMETLGVAEVVMTIFRARKSMPLATAATVSRERHGDAFHVQVSLMDDGASDAAVIADFIAGRLGEDLTDAFGGRDVIVLK